LETLKSYCVVCDAELGGCEHNAHRYLDEIVYKRTDEGWACPNEAEKERFYSPPKLRPPQVAVSEPKPVQQLIVEIEAWIPMDSVLEADLRTAYVVNPRALTLIADRIVADTQAGKLRNPSGLLFTKLKELQ